MKSYLTANPILVIDDEASILILLKRILSRNGYAVDTAMNGEDGIRKIENNKYSLILTDIEMPGISGDQVLDHLRNKIKKSTPIVGMSGTPWLLDTSHFDAVLPKPYHMKESLDIDFESGYSPTCCQFFLLHLGKTKHRILYIEAGCF